MNETPNKIKLTIDGRQVVTTAGKSVLEAALDAGIYIPNLCYHPDLSSTGACRLCVVEIDGMRGVPTSCTTEAAEGMVVKTDTPKTQSLRRTAMELMLASHPLECPTCPSNLNCQLQALAQYLGISKTGLRPHPRNIPLNASNPLFEHDLDKCVLCGRCVRACYELRGAGVLSFVSRGKDTYIGTAFDVPLKEAGCRFCGACIEVCPTGALRDKNGLLEPGQSRDTALVPCRSACPAGIDVPRYIRLVSRGKYSEAAAVIRERVPFPMVLGYVCDHPCEAACHRGEVNQPISIRALKRIAAEKDSGEWRQKARKNPPTGKKVAIIGSGPAGLTAAYYLSGLGHEVMVFEALPKAGGMLRFGIPAYRLPDAVLDAEIDQIMKGRFEIKTDTRIESLDNLFDSGYQAIFLAIGAHKGLKMGIEGEDSPGVIDAISFLRDIRLGKKMNPGKRIAIIGGGNVAIDAARSAVRLGASEVSILYRRTRAEMPASEEEIKGAEEEKINLVYLTAPKRIWNENGTLKLETIQMKLGEPDTSGRRRPEPVEGSESVSEYDTIIAAIGQTADITAGFGVETGRGNTIKINEDGSTGRPGVFAGGDAAYGPASVVKAIASGRKGAMAIDKYLGGQGVIDETLAPIEEAETWLGECPGFAGMERVESPAVDARRRTSGFGLVELGLDEQSATTEASRCLLCNLRLDISPVKFPPRRKTTKSHE